MTSIVCAVCYKDTSYNELIDVTDFDFDGICFLEKLRYCVSSDFESGEYNNLQMCQGCIDTLKLSYDFKQNVLNSLKALKCFEQRPMELETGISNDIEITLPEKPILRLKNEDKQLSSEQEESINELIKQVKREVAHPKLKNYCRECSLTFKNKAELQKHYTIIHDSPNICMYCGGGFKTTSCLKEHIASSHKQNISCPCCKKSFPQFSSLHRHLKTHFTSPGQKTKKTPFLCMICGKSFPFSNGAARHMRTHDGVKKHECQICFKKFNQSTHLQVHMRRHTGEKPYICEMCGDSFSLRARLLSHLKTWHKTETEEDHKVKTESY